MAIPRATTPTLTLTFTDETLDLTTASGVYVTLAQNNVSITKTNEDIVVSPKQVVVLLSQEETLRFLDGKVEIQVNWIFSNGKRACSDVQIIQMSKQLLKEVIE